MTIMTVRHGGNTHQHCKPPKCYYNEDNDIIDWIFATFDSQVKTKFSTAKNNKDGKTKHKKTSYKSFDCSIMDIADDIAYSIHDLEDAIHLKSITLKDFEEIKDELTIFSENNNDKESWFKNLFADEEYKRKEVTGHMIHTLITKIDIDKKDFKDPILKYNVGFKENSEAKKAVKALKNLIEEKVIHSQEVETIVFGGMMTVMQLFDAIVANPEKLLSNYFRKHYKDFAEHHISEETNRYMHRCVCDYISGMTDEYARRLHGRIYGDDPRSVFEKL